MTLRELADACQLTEAHISKVERGVSAVSIASLDRIAEALGVSLTLLIAEPNLEVATPLTRSADRVPVPLATGVTYEELIPARQEGPLSAALLTIPPGAASGEMSTHRGYEFRLVLSGSLTYDLGEDTMVLHAGDTAFADATTPHRWSNEGTEPCIIVAVATMPGIGLHSAGQILAGAKPNARAGETEPADGHSRNRPAVS